LSHCNSPCCQCLFLYLFPWRSWTLVHLPTHHCAVPWWTQSTISLRTFGLDYPLLCQAVCHKWFFSQRHSDLPGHPRRDYITQRRSHRRGAAADELWRRIDCLI
jgi:hypothetical protein